MSDLPTSHYIEETVLTLLRINFTVDKTTLLSANRAWPGFNSSIPEHAQKFLTNELGEKRKDLGSAVVLTVVYSLIFLSGVTGNICTCIVITKNTYLHTTTNYYLVNLAIADILTLLFALPPEVYMVWEAYPWRFGETFCLIKSFLSEMTYNTSVLTIIAFTIERYIAIFYPLKANTIFTLNRAVLVILATWVVGCSCAVPYPIYTRVFYYSFYPDTHKPLPESLLCNIPPKWMKQIEDVFEVSTFMFFVTPMIVITVMYIMIGLRIRTTDTFPEHQGCNQSKTAATKARRAVIKMLFAVVVAFFVCWAPFHSQRLMTLYIKDWNKELLAVQSHVFYVSGVLYFFSCTVNPILYNLLSRKFRHAFKRTFCRCCLEIDGFPACYRLKAKFKIGRHERTSFRHEPRPDKAILLATFNSRRQTDEIKRCPSSKDTFLRYSTRNYEGSGLPSSAHAHSDGRLQRQCRHKYCSCKLNANRRDKQLAAKSSINIYHSIPCDMSRDRRYQCDVTCSHVTDRHVTQNQPQNVLYLPQFDVITKTGECGLDLCTSAV